MKKLTLKLPEGAIQRGCLYTDSSIVYGLGDVLEVKLSNGYTVDLSWREDSPDTPFRVVVYREYFGDQVAEIEVATPLEAAEAVERFSETFTRKIAYHSCSESATDRIVFHWASGKFCLNAIAAMSLNVTAPNRFPSLA
jgi:hypothetical protein